jgi:hypothetical protein
MKRAYLISFFSTLLFLTGLTVGLPEKASAIWDNCQTKRVCTWIHINAGDPQYDYTGPRDGTCITIGPAFNNAITSVWNRFQLHKVIFYDTLICSGPYYTVMPNQQINFLSWPHADAFGSLRIVAL